METVTSTLTGRVYTLIDKLGEGSYGNVFSAACDDTDVVLTLKRTKKKGHSTVARERMKREMRMVNFFAGRDDVPKSVMRCVEAFETLTEFFVVSEFFDDFHSMERWTFGLDRNAMKIMISLAEALRYIHGMGLVHLDVKPSNVLISENDGVNLIDFGFMGAVTNVAPEDASVSWDDEDLISKDFRCGTIEYMSPEYLELEEEQNIDHFKVDIFALGMIFYELVHGVEVKLSDSVSGDPEATERLLFKAKCKPVVCSSPCPELNHLLGSMMDPDPSERVGSMDVVCDELRAISALLFDSE